MDIIKVTSLTFCTVIILSLALFGAAEIYNKAKLGSVLRPVLVTVQNPDDVGQPALSEVIDLTKKAQGIPEGRIRK